jgi:putative membrane protein
MFGPWGPGGFGWVEGLVWLIFWVAVIALAVVLLRRELPHMRTQRQRPPALDLLEERYARGEISREEFLERRDVLVAHHESPATPSPAPAAPAEQPPPAPEPPPPPGGAPAIPMSPSATPPPPTDLPKPAEDSGTAVSEDDPPSTPS